MPQSRVENILEAIVNGDDVSTLEPSQSRTEVLLKLILEKINDIDSVDPEEIASAVTDWLEAHPEATTTVQDSSISRAKLDSDLKEKTDAISGKVAIDQGSANAGKVLVVGLDGNVTAGDAGIPDAVKVSLLNIFQHVAYTDDQGQSYYNALYAALYADVVPASIEATIAQGYEPVCTTDTLEYVRKYITVMAHYSDGIDVEVNDYTLSGTLTPGTATISVQYMNKTDTVSVDVTQLPTGYTHRSCVIADGTQYINSGLSEVDVKDLGIAHKVARTSTTAGSTHILSSANYYMPLYRLNSGATESFVTANRYGGQTYTKIGNTEAEIGKANELVAFMGGNDLIVLNGADALIWPMGTTTPSSSNKLTFFAYGGNPSNSSYRFVGKFYYLKLFSGTTVVHDYIPCTNGSNVAGIYDAVTGTFLTPASGTLAWE